MYVLKSDEILHSTFFCFWILKLHHAQHLKLITVITKCKFIKCLDDQTSIIKFEPVNNYFTYDF